MLALAWERAAGCAPGGHFAPCLDSARTTEEEPTTSRSGPSGSRRSRACSGRRLPDRIGTYRQTVRRWKDRGMRPSNQHWKALVEVVDSLGLGHLFTESEEAPRR